MCGYYALSVRLSGVKGSAYEELSAGECVQVLPERARETAIAIGNYGDRHTFLTKDLIKKNASRLFCGEWVINITRVLARHSRSE